MNRDIGAGSSFDQEGDRIETFAGLGPEGEGLLQFHTDVENGKQQIDIDIQGCPKKLCHLPGVSF